MRGTAGAGAVDLAYFPELHSFHLVEMKHVAAAHGSVCRVDLMT